MQPEIRRSLRNIIGADLVRSVACNPEKTALLSGNRAVTALLEKGDRVAT